MYRNKNLQDADLIICAAELNDAGLHKKDLFQDDFVCVMDSSHPLASEDVTVQEFVSYGHAMLSITGYGPSLIDDALDSVGVTREICIRITSFLAIPYVIRNSGLIATLPRRLARDVARRFDVKVKELPFCSPRIRVAEYWHEHQHFDPAHQWLRSLVARQAIQISKPLVCASN